MTSPVVDEVSYEAVAPFFRSPLVRVALSHSVEHKLAGSTVKLSVRKSLAEIDDWFAPWYCNELGFSVPHDHPDACMISVGAAWSIPDIVDKFNLFAVAKQLNEQRAPISIVAPTLKFRGDITLVLDGNHRLAAARILKPTPELLVLELAADGSLLDQQDLPDLRHLTVVP